MAESKPDLTIVWAETGTVVEPDDTKKAAGYIAEKPAFEVFNWLVNRADRFLRHIDENGIPAWSSTVTYNEGSLVLHGKILKRSTSDTNLGKDPDSTTGWWDDNPYGKQDIPTGTRMFFHQATVPTGWTKDATLNDYMLRVVSGTGGGSGGSDSPILMDKVPMHVHPATCSTDGEHNHDGKQYFTWGGASNYAAVVSAQEWDATKIPNDGDHNHTVEVEENTGSNWTPKFINTIVGVKD